MTDTDHAEAIRTGIYQGALDGEQCDAALVSLDALMRQLAEKDAALQAAIQRAEAADLAADELGSLAEARKVQRDALQARVGKLEEALERIKGHTCPDVAPGTPPPDPRWIYAIARANLATSREGEK